MPSPPIRRDSRSGGQAMAEALIASAALAVLLLLASMVARLQDLGLRASHASRHIAMSLTRRSDTQPVLDDAVARFFDPRSARWVTRAGSSMLEADSTGVGSVGPRTSAARVRAEASASPLAVDAQVGAGNARAGVLRNELLFPDRGLDTGKVVVRPTWGPGAEVTRAGTDMLGMRAWEAQTLSLSRQVSILSGAGHAADDAAVSARIAGADQAWGGAASRSRQAGQGVATTLRKIDAAWGRADPVFDWLAPWQDLVPADRVGKERRP